MVGEQVYGQASNFWWCASKFMVRRATFMFDGASLCSLEQLSCSSSNFPFVGVTFTSIEQDSFRWSNFHVHRASLCSKEQLSCLSSNFPFDGATFTSIEQVRGQASNFPFAGATFKLPTIISSSGLSYSDNYLFSQEKML